MAGDTTGVNPSSVDTISGDDVTLTLATAVTSGQTVTLDYAVPGTNPLRDESELDAPGFTGQTVTNNTGSSDATLSGLTVEETMSGDAVALSPTFSSTATTYVAFVGSAVDDITLKPVVNDSNADYDVFDEDDVMLTDGDTGELGFQAELDTGENTFKIKVTAEDGMTTETYTVYVYRGPVWSTTLTIGIRSNGQSLGVWLQTSPNSGALADNTFVFQGRAFEAYNLVAATRAVSFRPVDNSDRLLQDQGLVLEWAGEALTLDDARWQGGNFIWTDAWLTTNAESLNGARHRDTLPVGGTGTVCLRGPSQTCPDTAVTAPADSDPTGLPTITGTTVVGGTLTAAVTGIADANGLVSASNGIAGYGFTYQWFRVDSDGSSNRTSITNATSTTYTIASDDDAKRLIVEVSFRDDANNDEGPLASAPTNTVGTATDATLSGLTVEETMSGDAVTLSPTFSSTATTYVAFVGSAVDDITLKPVVNNSNADYDVFDEDDMVLTDGDTGKLGFQAELDTGENTFGIKVTAEDGMTTETYTVYVYRGPVWSTTLTIGIRSDGQIPGVWLQTSPNYGALADNTFVFQGSAFEADNLVAGSLGLAFRPRRDVDELQDQGLVLEWAGEALTLDDAREEGGRLFWSDAWLTTNAESLNGARYRDTLPVGGTGTVCLRGPSQTCPDTAVTAPADSDPTGLPTITGTKVVGGTLTAAVTGIADANGLVSASNGIAGYGFTYQWFRVDSDGSSNRTSITNATSTTYTIASDDDAKRLIVEVSFRDDANNDEGPLASVASGIVGNNMATGAPTITGTAQAGQTLTAAKGTITDTDGTTKADNNESGFAYTYEWFRVDTDGTSNKTLITGATASTYTLTADEVGKKVIVEVSFTDDADYDEGPLPSAAYPSSGTVISNDTNPPTVESASVNRATLTIVFSEPLAAAPNLANGAFEVKKTPAGGSEQVVALAGSPAINGATLTLTLAAAVRHDDTDVKVSYTRPTSGSNNRLRDDVQNEVASFTDFAVNNQTPATNTPATGKPAVTGTARVGQTLTAGIGDIDDEDGLPSTFPDDYRFQWVRLDADGTSNPSNVGTDSATYTLVAADEGKRLRVDVTFTDDGGTQETRQSDATAVVESPDRTAPSVASATVNGDSLIIYFDEDLAAAPNLANSAFTVKKTPLAGSEETVGLSGDPSISGARVTLTLATAVDSTDGSVKVSYARPSSGSGNRLEDPSGNEAASFTDQAVTNITPAPGQESAVSTWYVYFDRTEYTASEGGAGARVTVRLNAPWKHAEALKVMLSTTELNGGASEADFRGVPASVTFQPGQTAVSFTVRATNDNEDDDGESIRFGINTRGYHDETTGTTRLGVDAVSSHPEDLEHLKTGQGPHTVTVHLKDNNGPRAVTVSFGEGAYTATEGGADATVEVRLSERPGRQVVVPLTRTHNGAGTDDYSGVPESLAFGSNETAKTFVVEAVDDSDDDDLESVTLGFGDLPSGVSAGSPARTVVNLDDNDEAEDVESIEETAQPKLTLRFGAADTRVAEVREGISFSLAVTLDGAADTDVHIPLEVAYTGGATAADVTGLPATLTIEAGQRRANVILRMVDDAEVDPGEGFTVTFGALPAGVKADERYDEARFTIIDNDIPEINVSDASANEPSPGRTVWLRFRVTLSRSIEERVRVNYATVDGTARAGGGLRGGIRHGGVPGGDIENT